MSQHMSWRLKSHTQGGGWSEVCPHLPVLQMFHEVVVHQSP